MVLEQALANLKELRDSFYDIVLEALEASAINAVSVNILQIQIDNKLGKEYFSEQYKRIREKKGRQTDFVDLTMTGDMMRGVKVVEATEDNGQVLVSFGFDRQEDFDKFTWTSERYGNYFLIDDEQRNEVTIDVTDYVKEKIDAILYKE